MKNKVQLITYVDRCGGGNLADLRALLAGPLANVFGAVHLLPFFTPIDGADAGFDPIDHTQVDPRLGDWSDVAALACELDVMADVIVNHMSDRSPQFLDYRAKGAASASNGLFLTRDAVFPGGASERELAAIYRPRPGRPFTDVTLQDGTRQTLWTTFTPHQIDIDVGHVKGQDYLARILKALSGSGVSMVRLDAVGYAIKKRGTSCFMIPETFEFIAAFADRARQLGIEVLVEVHSYYQRQIEIARLVDRVYDFALPPLLLHAFAFGTARHLKNWILIRPDNAVTVLDTHDGIGIIDIGADPTDRAGRPGLVPPQEIDALVESIHASSGGQSRAATGAAASNLDLYQVNCTFFDAMGRDERRYLLARAIQFFLPGVPQVYYVGLLAGANDMELLARTHVGRDINRRHYSRPDIEAELSRSVVQDLIALIRLRNTHPAFGGKFQLLDTVPGVLAMRWQHGADYAELKVNLATASHELVSSSPAGAQRLLFTSAAPRPAAGPPINRLQDPGAD
ncbi:MAG TPA: sucrose phosphorylase [Steroidobacteraceae bacterium]|nr:sucrose phosphorylase [Steroidobacteraceae bacterium]